MGCLSTQSVVHTVLSWVLTAQFGMFTAQSDVSNGSIARADNTGLSSVNTV